MAKSLINMIGTNKSSGTGINLKNYIPKTKTTTTTLNTAENTNTNAFIGGALMGGMNNSNSKGGLGGLAGNLFTAGAASSLAGNKAAASKSMLYGGILNVAESAGNLFYQVLNAKTNIDVLNLQEKNTVASAKNQMLAIDNQVMAAKNEMIKRFNEMTAQNTLTLAAQNLKVDTASVLEKGKETAKQISEDFATMDSNAALQKITLNNEIKQAGISRQLSKRLLASDMVSSAADLGLQIATGGGTGQSWGDLYNNYLEANFSLNDIYQ